MSIEEKDVGELEEGELDDDDDELGTVVNPNNENDKSNNNDQSLGSSTQSHAVRDKKPLKNHKKNGSTDRGHERKRKRRMQEGPKKSTNEDFRQSSPHFNSSYRSPRRHRKQDDSFYPAKRARNREVDRSDVEYSNDIGDGDNQYMENQGFNENDNGSPRKDFNKSKKHFPDRSENKNFDGNRENFRDRREYQRDGDRGAYRGGKFDRSKGRFASQHFEKPPRKSNNESSGLVCKYFLEGKCLKGANCTYIHDMNPPKRRELCRYYLTNRGCNKGICFYYHGDWPCKPYHTTGVCVAMQDTGHCQFSHLPLNDETRSLLSIPDDGDGNFRNPPFQEGFNRNFRDKEGFQDKRNTRFSNEFHLRENWNNFDNESRFENNNIGNKMNYNMDNSNERNMYANETSFNKPFDSHYGDEANHNKFDKLPPNNYAQNNNAFYNSFQKDDSFTNPDNKQQNEEKHVDGAYDNEQKGANLSIGPYNWTGSFGGVDNDKLKNENGCFSPLSKNAEENHYEEGDYETNRNKVEAQKKLDLSEKEGVNKSNEEQLKDIRSLINQPPPTTNLDGTSQRMPFNPLQQPPPLQSQPFPIQNAQRPVFPLNPPQQPIMQLVHPHQPIINLSQQPSLLNMTPQQQQPIIQLAQQQLQKQHGFFAPPPQQHLFPPQQPAPNAFTGILGRGPFPGNVQTQFPILPPQLDINQLFTNIVRNSATANQQPPFNQPFPIVSESLQNAAGNKLSQPTTHPPLVNPVSSESQPESAANKESCSAPKEEPESNQEKVIEKNEKDELTMVKPVSDPRLKNSNIPNILEVKMNPRIHFEPDKKTDKINAELEKEIESPKDEVDDLEKDGMASVVKYELRRLDDFQRPTIPIEMIANLKLKGNHQETKELLERDPRLTRYSQPTLKTLDFNFAEKFSDPRNQAKLSEKKSNKISSPPFKPLITSPKFDIKNPIFSQDILSPPPISNFDKPLTNTSLNDKPAKKVIDYRNDPRYKKKKVASKSSENNQSNQDDKDKNESYEEPERFSTTEVKLPGCNDTASFDFTTRASNLPSQSPTPTFPVFCTPGHFSTKLSNSYEDSGGYDTPSEQSTPINDDEDDDEEDSVGKNLPKINVTSNSFYSSGSTFTPFNLPTTSTLHVDAITHESYSKPLAYYKPLHEEESKERLDNSVEEDSSVSIKDMFKSIDPTNSPFC